MPTRQEVLEALRTVAEAVLASLKLLLTIVFTVTSAIEPNLEATEAQMNPVNQLIQEVTQQRLKIDQLGTIIQSQFLQKPPANPGPSMSFQNPQISIGKPNWCPQEAKLHQWCQVLPSKCHRR